VVTRIIKQLEAEGWITRRPDPSDNRFTLVQLTESGRARREQVVSKNRKMESTLLQGVSEEDMICTQRTLARIRQNAERFALNSDAGEETCVDNM
jgi:DNA-binding MarR family transcriptional regulator